MEKAITGEILKNTISDGLQPAIELLYTEYSDMLYGYLLQFIPDQQEAEDLLVIIFVYLSVRLEEACDSGLGVYCWLQIEARKIALHYKVPEAELPFSVGAERNEIAPPGMAGYYFTLLRAATYEQKWIFRELFLIGKGQEEVARQLDRDIPYIDGQLRESLVIISRNLM